MKSACITTQIVVLKFLEHITRQKKHVFFPFLLPAHPSTSTEPRSTPPRQQYVLPQAFLIIHPWIVLVCSVSSISTLLPAGTCSTECFLVKRAATIVDASPEALPSSIILVAPSQVVLKPQVLLVIYTKNLRSSMSRSGDRACCATSLCSIYCPYLPTTILRLIELSNPVRRRLAGWHHPASQGRARDVGKASIYLSLLCYGRKDSYTLRQDVADCQLALVFSACIKPGRGAFRPYDDM